uniref:Phosphatidylinositol transfer protein beta isoform n=1 Tax=Sander lucioperca TaxID=283035 RepID=A0A8C9ZEB1_SANLU
FYSHRGGYVKGNVATQLISYAGFFHFLSRRLGLWCNYACQIGVCRLTFVSRFKLYRFIELCVCNEYMKDDFMIKIETWHKPDMGTIENVHDLDEQTWRTVEVSPIDIANKEEVAQGDYKPEEDPALFHSAKTGRGPLGPEWKVPDVVHRNVWH